MAVFQADERCWIGGRKMCTLAAGAGPSVGVNRLSISIESIRLGTKCKGSRCRVQGLRRRLKGIKIGSYGFIT